LYSYIEKNVYYWNGCQSNVAQWRDEQALEDRAMVAQVDGTDISSTHQQQNDPKCTYITRICQRKTLTK